MPKIAFEVDSKAEPLLIVSTNKSGSLSNEPVDLQPEGAEKRKGEITLSAGTKGFLTWIFTGSPGAAYSISIKPEARVKLGRASNPIESSIATHRPATSGSDTMEIS